MKIIRNGKIIGLAAGGEPDRQVSGVRTGVNLAEPSWCSALRRKANLPGWRPAFRQVREDLSDWIRLDPTGSECSIFSNPIQASLSPGKDGWPVGGENEDEEDSSKRPSAYAKATARQDENGKIKPAHLRYAIDDLRAQEDVLRKGSWRTSCRRTSHRPALQRGKVCIRCGFVQEAGADTLLRPGTGALRCAGFKAKLN